MMVAHAAHNITVGLMPMVGGSAAIVALSYVAVAIVIVLDDGPANADPLERREASLAN